MRTVYIYSVHGSLRASMIRQLTAKEPEHSGRAGISQRVEDSHHPLDGRELYRPARVDLYLDVRSGPHAGEDRAGLASTVFLSGPLTVD